MRLKLSSKIFLVSLVLAFFAHTTEASSQIRINDFRFSEVSGKVRLVFDASGPINYTLKQFPRKIIITINNAKLIGLLNKTWLSKTPVNTVQSKQLNKNLRLTLNLKRTVKVKHFVLPKPYRLVLDFTENKEQPTPKDINVISPQPEFEQPEQEFKSFDLAESTRDIVVIIDPGHGGKESGAVGHRGTKEKDVALAIAKNLQEIINKNKGFKAVLTRAQDYSLSLRRRLHIAHKYKADMFIAVHADAYRYTTSHGASVFALSPKGATSEAARWLADKENESELGQVISDKNVALRSVLIDLAQAATISASLEIGEKILRDLGKMTALHSSKVEQAAFVVLKSPDIPSLLVETGFISNPREEIKLRSSKYQHLLSEYIAKGIVTYFKSRPPQGTYLAKQKNLQAEKM